ncbi:MAG: hypothetical protein JSU73_00260 [candidate division WOR-3 bacterium]|nr:MAG: hypothetical protein JSU73_00260 [candidate division WOR-3 bacterium]
MALVGGILPSNPVADFRMPDTRALVWGISVFPVEAKYNPKNEQVPVFLSAEAGPYVKYRMSGEELELTGGADIVLRASPFALDYGHGIYFEGHSYGAGSNVSGDVQWFPGGFPLGLAASVYVYGGFGTTYYAPTVRGSEIIPAQTDERGSVFVRLEGGPVLGRARDAKVVIQALRIERILLDEGVLDCRLPRETIQGLAELIATSWRWDFTSDVGRGRKHWYDELESWLGRRVPGLGSLPARTLFRIRDAMTINWSRYYGEPAGLTSVSDRTVGISVRPTGRVIYSAGWNRNTRGDNTISGTSSDTKLDFNGIQLDAGWPLTTELHLLAEATWGWPRNQNAKVTLSYLLGETWHVSTSIAQGYSWDETNRRFGLTAGGGLDWFVEDKLKLGCSISVGTDTGPTEESGSFRASSVGIGISLDRRLP